MDIGHLRRAWWDKKIKIMRILILLFVSISLSLDLHSQVYLGSTAEEIIKIEELPIQTALDSAGNEYLGWINKNRSAVIVYFLDKKSVLTIIVPTKTKEFNEIVRSLNYSAVALSDTEWRFYTDKDIVRVKIKLFDGLNRNAFYYTVSD